MPISEPAPQIIEMCEPDMIFTTSAAPLQRGQALPQRNIIMVALGAILMAAGSHYIFASLGIRR
jgi:hypothetical protein